MRDLKGKIKKSGARLLLEHNNKIPLLIALVLVVIFYFFSKNSTPATKTLLYKSPASFKFNNSRIIGSQTDSIYKGKERLLSKTVNSISKDQKDLKEAFDKLKTKLESLNINRRRDTTKQLESAKAPANDNNNQPREITDPPYVKKINFYDPSGKFKITQMAQMPAIGTRVKKYLAGPKQKRFPIKFKGPSIITFPVSSEELMEEQGIILPTGSYVKGKMLTGVDAPEGKTYPVLLQLDYAYIIPNNKRLDLSGCFMILKAQGNLSTERVQMQADKLSCVSTTGKMFERNISGYVADSQDNDFAVAGEVRSKQSRVVGVAFLSSIIEGISKAVQFAETTQTSSGSGGLKSIVNGDKMKYMAAGGVSNAAGMVTSWYLKQANNLLPTIKVVAGKDLWVVMQSSVTLPTNYFKIKSIKGSKNESIYNYLDGFTH